MNFPLEIEGLLKEIDGDFVPPLSSSVDLTEYSNKLYNKATIFSVHDKGALVAVMAVYCTDAVNRVAYGTMLAVAATHRIYGLGPNLIKSTLDFLKKSEFKVFRLEIYKTNPRVITLYRRLGFSIASETDTSVFVEKKLDE
ncbi:GNAT family N-acetyltransferase [Roseateles oligotrophus]|uniref:GNAT family N-acetyltransferase n=1 Tax=Roseateles oligotrophus TaxID=1769250 RepID=A0ABT2YIP5_9BURK|nr:GNAT family N-acetyltransferase [Roseateles oligotrophus]MCV2369882.1 GNAT family N-acetyltransferase [Roseateles oligotrophus]